MEKIVFFGYIVIAQGIDMDEKGQDHPGLAYTQVDN